MSQADAKRFLDALEQDTELQQKAGAIDAADGKEAARELIDLGAAHGYTFTAQDLAEAVGEAANANQELGEEQLERVAGGIGLLLPAIQKVREASLFGDGSVKLGSITDGTSNTFFKA